jgi:hypothetical protein
MRLFTVRFSVANIYSTLARYILGFFNCNACNYFLEQGTLTVMVTWKSEQFPHSNHMYVRYRFRHLRTGYVKVELYRYPSCCEVQLWFQYETVQTPVKIVMQGIVKLIPDGNTRLNHSASILTGTALSKLHI